MSTRTTGRELKAFYADKSVWQPQYYHEGEMLIIDGVARHENDRPRIDEIMDSSIVEVSGGQILASADGDAIAPEYQKSFEDTFNEWRKRNAD